jgi:hypothetical protein
LALAPELEGGAGKIEKRSRENFFRLGDFGSYIVYAAKDAAKQGGQEVLSKKKENL